MAPLTVATARGESVLFTPEQQAENDEKLKAKQLAALAALQAEQVRYQKTRSFRRRRGQSKLGRSLVHVDETTKQQLAAMSAATGIPQIQILTMAINALGESGVVTEFATKLEQQQASAASAAAVEKTENVGV